MMCRLPKAAGSVKVSYWIFVFAISVCFSRRVESQQVDVDDIVVEEGGDAIREAICSRLSKNFNKLAFDDKMSGQLVTRVYKEVEALELTSATIQEKSLRIIIVQAWPEKGPAIVTTIDGGISFEKWSIRAPKGSFDPFIVVLWNDRRGRARSRCVALEERRRQAHSMRQGRQSGVPRSVRQ